MVRQWTTFLITGLLITFSVSTFIDACGNDSSVSGVCPLPLPNIRARLTQRGLDYGAKLIVDFILKNPDKVNMPDFPVKVGSTTMTMSNMVIRRFPRPYLRFYLLPNTSSTISLDANGFATNASDQVQANITNLNPTIDATMKIVQNWRVFSTERQVNITATMRNMDLSVQASIEIDDAGRPIPSNIRCHATGDVSFVLKGEFQRWNWFVNSVYNAIKNQFRETVFDQVCLNLVNEINKFVENDLKNVSMSVDFANNYSFDYRFLTEPRITERFLETSHKGSVTSLGASSEQHGTTVPVIPVYPRQVEKMIYMYVTDSALSSFWYAAMANGHLQYSIDENTTDLSEASRKYLSTTCPGATCVGTIFPHLSLNYPNSVATVHIRAVNTAYPPFRFQGRSVRVRCKGIADFYIETATFKEKIFSISLTLASVVELNVSSQRIHFTVPVSSYRLDGDILSAPRNFIGVVPLVEPILDTYLMLLSRYVILPALQAIGKRGLPLQIPTVPDLQFVDTSIIETTVQSCQSNPVRLLSMIMKLGSTSPIPSKKNSVKRLYG